MSKGEETRRRILQAARGLLEGRNGPVSMGAIAAAAGVTRQLLYHHFEGRADLLLELSRMIDGQVRTTDLQAAIDEASTGVGALRATVQAQAAIKPQIDAITAVMDRLRGTDTDVAAAWDEREGARLDRCRRVIQRLDDERCLADDWEVEDGARLLWSTTGQHAWRELTQAGWTTTAWAAHTTALLTRALCAEPL